MGGQTRRRDRRFEIRRMGTSIGSVRASTEKPGSFGFLVMNSGIMFLPEIARELARSAEDAVGDHPGE